ncbi:hypothetical protein CEP54_010799 [Fusarium duplospermum]|uniref:FAD-binding domain-containing protein n=1 Tax=Fusarium duplospermum TaxID=1325734 RepID=A0A428PHY2_9HYPO|nr:hypothetical protein CEP54_010799 [Fusarium duplospermum]
MVDYSIPDAMIHRVTPSMFNTGDFPMPWIGDNPTLDERRQYIRAYLNWRLPHGDMENQERELHDLAERRAAMKLINDDATEIGVEQFEWLVDEMFWHTWLGHLGNTPPFPWTCPAETDELTEISQSFGRWLDMYKREGDLVKPSESGNSAPSSGAEQQLVLANETPTTAERSNESDQLQKLSQQVDQLRQELRQRDERIARMNKRIQQRDRHIAHKDRKIRQRDEQISEKDMMIRHQEVLLRLGSDQLDLLDKDNEDLEREATMRRRVPATLSMFFRPCRCSSDSVDVPQTLLEPVLIRHASHNGFKVTFNTVFLSFSKDTESGLITAVVRDKISQLVYRIRTRYLFGADGAQSEVVKQLELPLSRKPSQGLAINVLVKADLSHLVDSRRGNLHWIMQPDLEHPDFGWLGIVRMVKPWDEWMFILFPNRDWDTKDQPTSEQYLERIRQFIGDGTPAEILNTSKWFINEIVAEEYSRGNIFCLGDAVHRHPPMNGLGSNTCIQDAFNLAWKIAYVHNGWASTALLETYSHERQSIGQSIITRANQAFRDHTNIWNAIGALPSNDIEARRGILGELKSATPEGEARRKLFHAAIKNSSHEFHGLGIKTNQHYSGTAIYDADKPKPYAPTGRAAEDPVLYHEPSTYPGRRLPHVWVNTTIPSNDVSTIDLARGGNFVLFTGIGGDS